MIRDMEAGFRLDILLQMFQQIILELHDFPALGTNQMMMAVHAGICRINLITAAPISEFHFQEYPQIPQKLQTAIDGSQPDLRLAFPQDIMHILCAQMLSRMIHEDLQHFLPLRRQLMLPFLQLFAKIIHAECVCHDSQLPYAKSSMSQKTDRCKLN